MNVAAKSVARPAYAAKPRLLMVGASKGQLASPKKLRLKLPSYDVCVAVDGGAEWLRRFKMVPNLYIGDADTISSSTMRWLKKHEVRFISLNQHKDETDFSQAIQQVLKDFPQGAHIDLVGFLGGKADHFLAAVGVVKKSLLNKSPLTFTFIGSQQVALVLSSSEKKSVSMAEIEGEPTLKGVFLGSSPSKVSLIPLTKCIISEKGFKWDLRNKLMSPLDDLGISNEIASPEATLVCHKGIALFVFSRNSRKSRKSRESWNLGKSRKSRESSNLRRSWHLGKWRELRK